MSAMVKVAVRLFRQTELRRQKRHEVSSAARVVEEAVSVLGAAHRRRARSKSSGALLPAAPGPQAQGAQGGVVADLEALALSRRTRFRRGVTLANTLDTRSDGGGLQEAGPASDDPAIDSEFGKASIKKKKKRKLGLPKRVKRVLSATAAISNKTSEKPR